MALFYQESKVYAGVWGIAITLGDLYVLTPRQKTLKLKAAKIQEAFDCDVLDLAWRSVVVGDRPDPEDVAAWSRPRQNDDVLRNWYPPEVGELPLPLARVICQRANCWWDAELRRRYAKAALGVIAAIFLVTVTIALIGHFRMDQWLLTVVLPLVPVFILGLRQFSEQKEAADRMDVLRHHAERIWRELLAGAPAESITQQSRELQDEIFDHRRRNPLIFDWVYRLLRDHQEELMNRAASDLIEEARTRLNL